MAHSAPAIVTPTVLQWARRASGLHLAQAAQRMQLEAERIERWESGEDRPSVAQLRNLAAIYKRPVAIFYLPAPPDDPPALHDFRHAAGEATAPGPELLLGIRRAHAERETAVELAAALGQPIPRLRISAKLGDPIPELAARVRKYLSPDIPPTGGAYPVLRAWRTALENRGILVVQISGVDTAEMRGFSIAAAEHPVIAVNSRDPATARIFSALHEFGHLILREAGLCDFDSQERPKDVRVESFCNRLAAEVLVPGDQLATHPEVAASTLDALSFDRVTEIARGFGVSDEVVVRRLLELGSVTRDYYKNWWQVIGNRRAALAGTGSGSGPPHYRKIVSNLGTPYVRLVLGALDEKKITLSSALGYLSAKADYLDKIRDAVAPRDDRGVG